jgi:hypothetical protein
VKLFSTNDEPAAFSLGMHPVGILAVGQFARGFIAIGQLAVGVVTLGQGCVSVVGLGQGGIGVTWFGGMLGVGGRGFCLRLIPGLDPPRQPPPTLPIEQLLAGQPGAEGFVRADIGTLAVAGNPRGHLFVGGQPLPIKPTPGMRWALDNAIEKTPVRKVFAHLKNVGGVLVCDRLVEVPGQRPTYPLGMQMVRLALLCGVATFWWYLFAWLDWS